MQISKFLNGAIHLHNKVEVSMQDPATEMGVGVAGGRST